MNRNPKADKSKSKVSAVQWTMKTRLLFLVIVSLIVTSSVISYIAYDKSKALMYECSGK